jgi:hypothetical protein
MPTPGMSLPIARPDADPRRLGREAPPRVRLTSSAAPAAELVGGSPLGGAFGTRHLRAAEPVTSGAYGEGPAWRMGVTFGVSIVRAAFSCGALLASGRHPRPRPSLDLRTLARRARPPPCRPRPRHTTAARVAVELTLASGPKQERDHHPLARRCSAHESSRADNDQPRSRMRPGARAQVRTGASSRARERNVLSRLAPLSGLGWWHSRSAPTARLGSPN